MTENLWRRPAYKGRRLQSPQERIWWSVRLDRATGCWNWQKAKIWSGYGKFTRWDSAARKLKAVSAHRFSYETFVGPIPPGMSVCHRCDNRSCCNPEHLFLGTEKDNAVDRDTKDRAGTLGEKNVNAKLTVEKVREIRARYAAGSTSQAELGELYGVTDVAISYVISKKTWKHVTAEV